MTAVWIWTIVIVLALVIEAFTMELVPIWLALAGIAGLVMALCGVDLIVQIIVVAVLAIIFILLLRPFALKFLHKTGDKTSVDSLLGKKAKLIEDVSKEKSSTMKVNGIIWTVISDETIKKDTEVEVVEIKGNKLKVKKGDN